MWKTLPVSSLNFFCCCSGDRGWVFFFSFPFNFLFIVECMKWSKANFGLTKFKNYFLCSYIFLWKFIPVCTREEMTIWSLSHTWAFWVEQLRSCGPPWIYLSSKNKDRQTSLGLKGSRLSPRHIFGVSLLSGRLCGRPWLNYKWLQRSEQEHFPISKTSSFTASA